jgi:hypothetical protein
LKIVEKGTSETWSRLGASEEISLTRKDEIENIVRQISEIWSITAASINTTDKKDHKYKI